MRKIIITIDDDGRFVDISTEEVGKENEVEENTNEEVTEEHEPLSQYARIFDDTCVGWTNDSEYNLAFLTSQQTYINDKLKHAGYVFLNEVYDIIGLPRTRAGQIMGWCYNKENPNSTFIDFGLFKTRNSDFINGYKSTAILDFNVNANLLEMF